MLNRVGEENQVGFLSIDFDKLGKEVKELKDTRERKPEEQTRFAKQTSGDLHKQKSMNMIGFLEGNTVPTSEAKPEQKVDSTPAQHLSSAFDPSNLWQRGASVRSAAAGEVTDIGGPKKQIKHDTAASIWNPNKIAQLADALNQTTRERVAEQKATTEEHRRHIRQQANDSLVDALAQVDQRKASQVSNAGTYEGTNYKAPTKGMSIWDNSEALEQFRQEKTEGERLAERRRQEAAQKDDSWKVAESCTTSKSITSRLFDKLMEGK
ncbi:MAG: hypothetical protein HC888_01680 [Candidatus Competibacteraceae bacterium]|nr:hypothetical protein [Candidatus Competibacteraceae bacterium]